MKWDEGICKICHGAQGMHHVHCPTFLLEQLFSMRTLYFLLQRLLWLGEEACQYNGVYTTTRQYGCIRVREYIQEDTSDSYYEITLFGWQVFYFENVGPNQYHIEWFHYIRHNISDKLIELAHRI